MGPVYLLQLGLFQHTVPRHLFALPGLAPVMSYRQMRVMEHRSPASGKVPLDSGKPAPLPRKVTHYREIYHLLTNPPPTPNGALLRTQRHHTQITLTHAATALQTHPNRISQLERGLYHNHHLATQYQHWLTQQNPVNI